MNTIDKDKDKEVNKEEIERVLRLMSDVGRSNLTKDFDTFNFAGVDVTVHLNDFGLYDVYFLNKYGQTIRLVVQAMLTNINPLDSSKSKDENLKFPLVSATNVLNWDFVRSNYFTDKEKMAANPLMNDVDISYIYSLFNNIDKNKDIDKNKNKNKDKKELLNEEITGYYNFINKFMQSYILNRCIDYFFALLQDKEAQKINIETNGGDPLSCCANAYLAKFSSLLKDKDKDKENNNNNNNKNNDKNNNLTIIK